MDDLTIQKRNFEIQKDKLKKFSEDIPSSVNLPSSKTESGLFGWSDHKVTGEQFNNLTNEIQTYLKSTNSYVIKIIKEFNEIYNTFDKLDKEYLNKIIAGVKAAEIASNQAKENSNDIRKLVEIQKLSIDKLKKFKDEFETIHQIGEKWNYLKDFKEQIQSIQDKSNNTEKQINEHIAILEQRVANHKEDILGILDNLSSDIFTKINSVSQNQAEQNQNLNRVINSIQDNFNENKKQINEQLVFHEEKVIKQKEDILGILDSLSSFIYTKINTVSQTQKTQNQNLIREIKSIHSDILEIKNKNKIQERLLSKKILIAFILVGMFGSISLTHLILNILGVL